MITPEQWQILEEGLMVIYPLIKEPYAKTLAEIEGEAWSLLRQRNSYSSGFKTEVRKILQGRNKNFKSSLSLIERRKFSLIHRRCQYKLGLLDRPGETEIAKAEDELSRLYRVLGSARTIIHRANNIANDYQKDNK